MQSHNSFKCDICSETFNKSHDLRSHKETQHREQIPCQLCDKTFKNNKNAKKHMKTIHEDKELFDCEYCHKQFKDKYNLKHHTQNSCLVKFGRSTLICSICQKGFSTKQALAAHKKIHEASNIEKGDQSLYPYHTLL